MRTDFFSQLPSLTLAKKTQTKAKGTNKNIYIAQFATQSVKKKKKRPGTQQDIRKEILGLNLLERRKDVGMNSLQNRKCKHPPLAKR